MNGNFNINRGKPQTFGDLVANESEVFLLDPNTATIIPTRVRDVKVLKQSGRDKVLQIQIYKLTSLKSVTPEKMEEAFKEQNTKVWWTIRALNKMVLGPIDLPGVGVTTFISADRKELETWMTKTGPNRKTIISL
jgi:hypothetical protein